MKNCFYNRYPAEPSRRGSATPINSLPIESKYKYIQTLNESGDQLLYNYQLMDIITYCEDAIGMGNIPDIEKRLYERCN